MAAETSGQRRSTPRRDSTPRSSQPPWKYGPQEAMVDCLSKEHWLRSVSAIRLQRWLRGLAAQRLRARLVVERQAQRLQRRTELVLKKAQARAAALARRMHTAALLLQKWARAFLLRRTAQRAVAWRKEVLVAQKRLRKFEARREILARLQTEDLVARQVEQRKRIRQLQAVICIQRFTRGLAARWRYRVRKSQERARRQLAERRKSSVVEKRISVQSTLPRRTAKGGIENDTKEATKPTFKSVNKLQNRFCVDAPRDELCLEQLQDAKHPPNSKVKPTNWIEKQRSAAEFFSSLLKPGMPTWSQRLQSLELPKSVELPNAPPSPQVPKPPPVWVKPLARGELAPRRRHSSPHAHERSHPLQTLIEMQEEEEAEDEETREVTLASARRHSLQALIQMHECEEIHSHPRPPLDTPCRSALPQPTDPREAVPEARPSSIQVASTALLSAAAEAIASSVREPPNRSRVSSKVLVPPILPSSRRSIAAARDLAISALTTTKQDDLLQLCSKEMGCYDCESPTGVNGRPLNLFLEELATINTHVDLTPESESTLGGISVLRDVNCNRAEVNQTSAVSSRSPSLQLSKGPPCRDSAASMKQRSRLLQLWLEEMSPNTAQYCSTEEVTNHNEASVMSTRRVDQRPEITSKDDILRLWLEDDCLQEVALGKVAAEHDASVVSVSETIVREKAAADRGVVARIVIVEGAVVTAETHKAPVIAVKGSVEKAAEIAVAEKVIAPTQIPHETTATDTPSTAGCERDEIFEAIHIADHTEDAVDHKIGPENVVASEFVQLDVERVVADTIAALVEVSESTVELQEVPLPDVAHIAETASSDKAAPEHIAARSRDLEQNACVYTSITAQAVAEIAATCASKDVELVSADCPVAVAENDPALIVDSHKLVSACMAGPKELAATQERTAEIKECLGQRVAPDKLIATQAEQERAAASVNEKQAASLKAAKRGAADEKTSEEEVAPDTGSVEMPAEFDAERAIADNSTCAASAAAVAELRKPGMIVFEGFPGKAAAQRFVADKALVRTQLLADEADEAKTDMQIVAKEAICSEVVWGRAFKGNNYAVTAFAGRVGPANFFEPDAERCAENEADGAVEAAASESKTAPAVAVAHPSAEYAAPQKMTAETESVRSECHSRAADMVKPTCAVAGPSHIQMVARVNIERVAPFAVAEPLAKRSGTEISQIKVAASDNISQNVLSFMSDTVAKVEVIAEKVVKEKGGKEQVGAYNLSAVANTETQLTRRADGGRAFGEEGVLGMAIELRAAKSAESARVAAEDPTVKRATRENAVVAAGEASRKRTNHHARAAIAERGRLLETQHQATCRMQASLSTPLGAPPRSRGTRVETESNRSTSALPSPTGTDATSWSFGSEGSAVSRSERQRLKQQQQVSMPLGSALVAKIPDASPRYADQALAAEDSHGAGIGSGIDDFILHSPAISFASQRQGTCKPGCIAFVDDHLDSSPFHATLEKIRARRQSIREMFFIPPDS